MNIVWETSVDETYARAEISNLVIIGTGIPGTNEDVHKIWLTLSILKNKNTGNWAYSINLNPMGELKTQDIEEAKKEGLKAVAVFLGSWYKGILLEKTQVKERLYE